MPAPRSIITGTPAAASERSAIRDRSRLHASVLPQSLCTVYRVAGGGGEGGGGEGGGGNGEGGGDGGGGDGGGSEGMSYFLLSPGQYWPSLQDLQVKPLFTPEHSPLRSCPSMHFALLHD